MLLETSPEKQIAYLTINREKKRNALDIETIQELGQAFDHIENLDAVRAVILTGKGEKAFAAGADIAEFKDFDSARGKEMSQNGHQVFDKIENFTKPVLAAIHGFALGGGCELAMACHLRIATHHAKFGQPEVGLGTIPGYGGTQRLTRLIGKTKALEFLMSGEPITASNAENLGLVNYVVDPENLMNKAEEFLDPIKEKSPLALKKVIECVNAAETEKGFEKEQEAFGAAFDTEDFKEGTDAFLNKRSPNFKGK